MNENVKRLFHVRALMHPLYAEIIATRPEIRFDKLENDTPDPAAEPILSAAHAYQVSSARDEVPRKYHATAELLERTPKLLIVSTGGAGFDTVNVKDCTERGVLVVNQTGGNAAIGGAACARHGDRALEADRADQPRAARRHHEGPQSVRRP